MLVLYSLMRTAVIQKTQNTSFPKEERASFVALQAA